MSRLTSIPSFSFETRAVEDDASGRTVLYPIIRAEADGYSLGMLSLNEMADLHILRARIEDFIFTNNIPEYPMEESNEKEAPRFTAIIQGYLAGYRPMNRGNFNPKKMTIRTSQEIIGDLAEMVDIELNDVAEAMLHLGYCTAVSDHKVGWLLGIIDAED